MIAFLNANDIDNVKLAIDKMKGVDFDAARKMELLVKAYEAQNGDEAELAELKEEVESLPGFGDAADHISHVRETAALLDRTVAAVQAWDESKDDEPLDEAVGRLVEIAKRKKTE